MVTIGRKGPIASQAGLQSKIIIWEGDEKKTQHHEIKKIKKIKKYTD